MVLHDQKTMKRKRLMRGVPDTLKQLIRLSARMIIEDVEPVCRYPVSSFVGYFLPHPEKKRQHNTRIPGARRWGDVLGDVGMAHGH
jgi:hypothetical protein